MKSKYLLPLIAALCHLFTANNPLHAQGTAFGYQGRLTSGTNAANGSYDLTFAIFSVPSGAGQVGATLTNTPTAVSNGMFTVTLDFGPGVFDGAARWLEIGVRTNSGDAYTTLSPRQALSATPYAIRAQTATAADGVAANAVNGTGIAVGAVVKSLNGLHDAVTLTAGTNVTVTPSGNTLTVSSTGGGGVFSLNDTNAYYNAGNVGIGSSTPASKLEVTAQDALGLIGFQPFLTLKDSNAGNARSRVQGVNGSVGLFTESYISGANPFAYLTLDNSGNVGLGSSAPVSKLEVVAQDALSLIGYQPFLTLKDSSAGYARSRIQGANGELVFETEGYINGSSPNGYMGLNGVGNLSVGTLTIRGGADLAEPFTMTEKGIEKGSVVVIDREHPGQLRLSTQAYDTRVAGVVSGANGIASGISLRQEGRIEGGANVALTGRVYVNVDATESGVEPGDLLTTSHTPGHAMKVTDHAKAQGAILGKAMSSLREGKGLVLVLVTLQ